MQHTSRISKAAPAVLSYLPRFIKVVRADFERSANMPKHALIKYRPLYRLLQEPEEPHLCSSLVPYPEFRLNPACTVLSSPATVTEYIVHTTFKKKEKKPFSDSWDLKT